MELSEKFEQFEWFGNGPHESYVDRKSGVRTGHFHSNVSDQYVPYIVPQEHGNLTDLRWVALSDGDQRGIFFSSSSLFEGSVNHYPDQDLYKSSHAFKLNPKKETSVYLDHKQRGLGTASCGPDTLEHYKISGGTHYFDFYMRGFPLHKESPEKMYMALRK